MDIISREKALEGGTGDVREAQQTIHAAVQVPGGHGNFKRNQGHRPDCQVLLRSSGHADSLEERVHRERAGGFLPADHHPGVRVTDRGTGTADRA